MWNTISGSRAYNQTPRLGLTRYILFPRPPESGTGVSVFFRLKYGRISENQLRLRNVIRLHDCRVLGLLCILLDEDSSSLVPERHAKWCRISNCILGCLRPGNNAGMVEWVFEDSINYWLRLFEVGVSLGSFVTLRTIRPPPRVMDTACQRPSPTGRANLSKHRALLAGTSLAQSIQTQTTRRIIYPTTLVTSYRQRKTKGRHKVNRLRRGRGRQTG